MRQKSRISLCIGKKQKFVADFENKKIKANFNMPKEMFLAKKSTNFVVYSTDILDLEYGKLEKITPINEKEENILKISFD